MTTLHKTYLHLAGGLSLGAYAWMASESQALEEVPLSLFYTLLAIPWMAMLLLWSFSRDHLRFREIVVWAILFRLIGCWAEPIYEDDHFRFLWDGYQFSQTGDPYTGTPLDSFTDRDVPDDMRDVLDQVNHPNLPTIYGPPMELVFLVNHWLWPASLVGLKVLFLLFEAAMLFALSRMISRRMFLFAAWCPLLVIETSFQAHPDIIGVSMMTLAVWAARSQKPIWAMLGQGTAMASKVFALLTWPFLLTKKKWFLQCCVAAGVLGVFYLPFILQGSNSGLVSTKAMATDWEFNAALYSVLKIWLVSDHARLVSLGLFAFGYFALLAWYWSKLQSNSQVEAPLDVVYGFFFLCSPVINPWYLLWMFPFVMLKPRCWSVTALIVVGLSYVTGLNLHSEHYDNFENPRIVKIVEFGAVFIAAIVDIIRWKTKKSP